MEKKSNINFVNVAMFALIFLFIAVSKINSISSILIVIAIIPMVLLTMGSDIKFSGFILMLACVEAYIINGAEYALLVAFVYLIPAFISGIVFLSDEYIDRNGVKYKIKVRKNGSDFRFISIKALLLSMIFFVIGSMIYIVSVKYLLNIDIIKELRVVLNDTLQNVLEVYKNSLKPSEYEKIVSSGVLDILKDTSTVVLVLCFSRSLIFSLVSYFICIKLYSCFYSEKTMCVPIESIYFPGRPVSVLFYSILLMFLIDYSYPNLGVSTMIGGYIIIMNMLFFMEGVSIIIYAVKNWKKIKSRVNILIFAFLVIFLGIVPGISILGMFDNSFDLRKRWNLTM